MSDAELIRAAQRGDAMSFGILLERHRALLHALALRMLGRGPQAQDAVQDVFVIAVSSIERLREPEAVGAWLRGILRNVCLMRLREQKGEIPFDELSLHVESESPEASAEQYIDRLALREWVWTALLELPETLRITAMLRYFGSYSSYEEISAILGVPVGTVRSRLSRVKSGLAEALLRTAGLEHNEARNLMESQVRYFTEAADELNRGEGCEMFLSPFSDDPVWVYSDGTVRHGRASVVGVFKEGSLEAGIKLHLTNVLVSRDVTILEGDFENPPDDPFHCPPATSMVYFYHDGGIHLTHQYFASRPEKKRHDRLEKVLQEP